jgi:PAS domain S-box-containing protein
MWTSNNFFGDTYTANLCLFGLFAVCFELTWDHATCGPRLWWYILCIIGLSFSGVLLVRESINVRACDCQAKAINRRIDEMLSKVPGAVFATDDEGVIRAVSPGVIRLTGFSRHELIGSSLTLVFPEETVVNHTAIRREAVKQMHKDDDHGWLVDVVSHVPLQRKNGETIDVSMYVFGVRHSLNRQVPDDIKFVSLVTPEK